MKQELQEKIYNDFPELYRGRTKSLNQSLMSFGLSVGNGWYDLLYKLSEDITTYCKENQIVIPEVVQVKEKFGGLRYYLESWDESQAFICKIIHEAEVRSFKICENCGNPGSTTDGAWIRVLCDSCKEDHVKAVQTMYD